MDPFLGMICAFGFDYSPWGWRFCDGALISIQQNSALYALLGIRFGGNGTTNFALPDLRGRVIVGQGKNPVTQTQFLMGATGGSETITQIPAHTHNATLSLQNATTTVKASNSAGIVATPADRNVVLGGVTSGYLYNGVAPSVPLNVGGNTVTGSVNISQTGATTPISNFQPYLVLNTCIAVQGLFPPRE